jgi:hypothetical protein
MRLREAKTITVQKLIENINNNLLSKGYTTVSPALNRALSESKTFDTDILPKQLSILLKSIRLVKADLMGKEPQLKKAIKILEEWENKIEKLEKTVKLYLNQEPPSYTEIVTQFNQQMGVCIASHTSGRVPFLHLVNRFDSDSINIEQGCLYLNMLLSRFGITQFLGDISDKPESHPVYIFRSDINDLLWRKPQPNPLPLYGNFLLYLLLNAKEKLMEELYTVAASKRHQYNLNSPLYNLFQLQQLAGIPIAENKKKLIERSIKESGALFDVKILANSIEELIDSASNITEEDIRRVCGLLPAEKLSEEEACVRQGIISNDELEKLKESNKNIVTYLITSGSALPDVLSNIIREYSNHSSHSITFFKPNPKLILTGIDQKPVQEKNKSNKSQCRLM